MMMTVYCQRQGGTTVLEKEDWATFGIPRLSGFRVVETFSVNASLLF